MSQSVVVQLVDGVLRLTLARPAEGNLLDAGMIARLAELVADADLDRRVRVLAVGGASPDFCVGVEVPQEGAGAGLASARATAEAFGALLLSLDGLSKPTVAIVRGRALAGGAGLALACDVVIAARAAVFAFPEVAGGLVPAVVMPFVRGAVGPKVAFDLLATGRPVTGEEALVAGLVSRVYAEGDLERAADELLRTLAGRGPTPLALLKREFRALEGRSLQDGVRLGIEVATHARGSGAVPRVAVPGEEVPA